eukprot:5474083-Pleurochrysis_carterae.AAC.1
MRAWNGRECACELELGGNALSTRGLATPATSSSRPSAPAGRSRLATIILGTVSARTRDGRHAHV